MGFFGDDPIPTNDFLAVGRHSFRRKTLPGRCWLGLSKTESRQRRGIHTVNDVEYARFPRRIHSKPEVSPTWLTSEGSLASATTSSTYLSLPLGGCSSAGTPPSFTSTLPCGCSCGEEENHAWPFLDPDERVCSDGKQREAGASTQTPSGLLPERERPWPT